MQRENERLYNNMLILVDVIITIIIFFAAYYIKVFDDVIDRTVKHQYILLCLLIIPIWYILLKTISIQSSQRVKAYSIIFVEYSLIILLGTSILFIFIFIFKLNYISRLAILMFGLTDLFLLSLIKILIVKNAKRLLIKGKNVKNIIIVADEGSISFIEKIIIEKYLGLNIFAIFSNSKIIIEKYNDKFLITNDEEKIYNIIEQQIIDEVIYCKNEINKEQIKNLIYICGEIGVTLQLQSEIFSLIASKSHLNYLGDLPIISFEVTSADYFALTIKSVFEFVFSFFAVLLFLPFYLLIAILIKAESKGPILFKQKRVGLHGRTFTMLKFRTMQENAEELKKDLLIMNEVDGPVFKIKKDPRITKIGTFLRKTSLDEFPQFLNVLQGDMALVGPRPPVPDEVALYERHQLRKLSMKPGITCIWQASERNNFSFEEWIKLDLQYIDNWSLKLDFILILKTIKAIFKRTGY